MENTYQDTIETEPKPIAIRDISQLKMPLVILNVGVILITVVLLGVFYLPNEDTSINSIISTSVLLGLATISLLLTYFVSTKWAAFVFMSAMFYSTINIGLSFGGLSNPTVSALFFLAIPISAMYFDRIVLLGFSVLESLAAIGMYVGGQNGYRNLTNTALDDTLVFVSAITVTALVLNFTQSRLKNSLTNEQKNAKTLKERNEDLISIQENLETIIQNRTADVERRSQYLEAISEISHDTNSILNPEQLLESVVQLISKKFDFYHVGIFLNDEQGDWTHLRAASSEGGQEMMARNHQLEIGKRGIVGYVTGIGQPRISQNIGLDYVHTVAKELPETRSEMALPLKARGIIIGALDIQDSKENAFLEEDIKILQTLADQVALAISNAELYQQAQSSLDEVRRASGEGSRRAWKEAQVSGRLPSYRYIGSEKAQTTRVETGALPEIDHEDKIAIPIQVRGQTIGTIDILKAEEEDWNESEVSLLTTLSEQLGVALDGARLFDETQQRAANERLIGDITTTIRESLDMETILKNAASKIQKSLELPQVTIRLTNTSTTNPSTNGREIS